MSLLHTLGWDKYPTEFDDYPALKLFFKTSSSLCSKRNTINKANPSKNLLKALYYLLPTINHSIEQSKVMKLANGIELLFSSVSTDSKLYIAQYYFSNTDDIAHLHHECPGHSDHNLCYHSCMIIAVTLLLYAPECAFSKAYAKLVSIFKKKGTLNDDDVLKQLVTTHDELYFDMFQNIIPVTNNFKIETSFPMNEQEGTPFEILSLVDTILNNIVEITLSTEEFNDNMEQLSDLIIAGLI